MKSLLRMLVDTVCTTAAYIRARRVKEGRALQYALQPRPLQAFLGAILVSDVGIAQFFCALLLHDPCKHS